MAEMRPTEAELEVLRVLWGLRGPATVKDVAAHYGQGRDLGYTAVLKLMQTMHEKGLLRRDASERAHRYWPTEAPEATRSILVGDLIERAFEGSAGALVQTALQGRQLDESEREALLKLLSER
nr:BlaI/MecI/CopY family transcriptional regulator [uncultured Holophaga sp.]